MQRRRVGPLNIDGRAEIADLLSAVARLADEAVSPPPSLKVALESRWTRGAGGVISAPSCDIGRLSTLAESAELGAEIDGGVEEANISASRSCTLHCWKSG